MNKLERTEYFNEQSLVTLESVSRIFSAGRVRAVDQVDLAIGSGEWLTISGASGSGKSTLLSLISGLDSPSSGRVLIQGKPVESSRAWGVVRRELIGLVFQSFHLLPTLTASENVQVPMFGNGLSRAQRAQRALNLLERVGLAQAVNRRPSELSGGELQRVAIARALANRPRLILADEPTGNLDSVNSRHILDLLKEVHQEGNTTVVMVTHDPVIGCWGDHRVRMKDGRVDQQMHCRLDDPCFL